jgi:hypothetical protein
MFQLMSYDLRQSSAIDPAGRDNGAASPMWEERNQ